MIQGQSVKIVRFRLNNLVVASVGAAGSTNVDVAITAVPADWVGATGWAVPTDADMTAGLAAPMARITSTTNLRLRFSNGSAGAIDPADTFDLDAFVFLPTGMAQQTI
jgi:hypothetical protein